MIQNIQLFGLNIVMLFFGPTPRLRLLQPADLVRQRPAPHQLHDRPAAAGPGTAGTALERHAGGDGRHDAFG